MGRKLNHYDYMDAAIAPIEAQRDDALEELTRAEKTVEELQSLLRNVYSTFQGVTEELKRENRLLRVQYDRRVEERDLMAAELRGAVKDLLDLTEYGDIDGMVWELVNEGDEWVVERLNRAQALINKGGD